MEKDDIDILSRSIEPSIIGGAQFLHLPIYDEEPAGSISFVQLGTPEGYAEKVYSDIEIETSWDSHRPTVHFWPLQKTYERLWEQFKSCISVSKINGYYWDHLDYDVIISTIPATDTCFKEASHGFPVTKFLIARPFAQEDVLPITNCVVYSGRPEDEWFRLSRINEQCWYEHSWPKKGLALPTGVIHGEKPMGTNCDCCETRGVIRAGRFGTWDRKVLLHHVPDQVEQGMIEKGIWP